MQIKTNQFRFINEENNAQKKPEKEANKSKQYALNGRIEILH